MVLAADYPFLDVVWTMFVFFGFVLWFSLLIKVYADIFRRHDTSGWAKFGWSMFVLVMPLLGVFIYLIAQGRQMAQRDLERNLEQKAAFDAYIREAAAAGNGGDSAPVAATKA
jgi:biopolymer transport protein ExbB/TolQ